MDRAVRPLPRGKIGSMKLSTTVIVLGMIQAIILTLVLLLLFR